MLRIALAWILCAAALTAQSGESPLDVATNGPDVRLDVPPKAKLDEISKLVKELLKDDFAKARTPAAKDALAAKLIEQGIQTNDDPAGKYVSLTEALRVASEAGSLDRATAAIAQLEEFFKVDGAALRRRALRDIIAQSKEPEALRAAAAFQKLEANLADVPANLAIGRYLCFHREMWDAGLPFLAASGDEKLAGLANEEINKPADALLMNDMADAWWEVSLKEGEPRKSALKRRAGFWYQQAIGGLTGLTKVRAEKRVTEVPAAAAGAIAVAGRKINLLPMIDPARDGIRGTWKLENGKLFTEPGSSTSLEIPYKPPEEYDFRVAFVRQSGGGCVTQFITADHLVMFSTSCFGDRFHAFEMCDGKYGNENASQTLATPETKTVNGKTSEVLLRVRKGAIEVLVNGKCVQKWDQDINRLKVGGGWSLRNRPALGVGANNSKVEFQTLEVTEIGGAGTLLKPK